jgi:hypothetical protein
MKHFAEDRKSFDFFILTIVIASCVLVLASCQRNAQQMEKPNIMTEEQKHNSVSASELESNFRALLNPSGDGPSRREHDAAVHFLVEHADQSYPLLLNSLRANPTALNAPPVIEILPLFKRSESIPVLEQIMQQGVEQVSQVAGIALGRHSDVAARDALLRGLESSSRETVIAAIDGLLFRADLSTCDSLRKFFRNSDANIRDHALHAAVKIGCVSDKEADQFRKQNP